MGSKAIVMHDTAGNKVYPSPWYPVGSIYISVNNTNPSTYFGGTWERIQDKFLLCAGSTYGAGTTGGSATHVHSTGDFTLKVDHIPSHNHTFNRGTEGNSYFGVTGKEPNGGSPYSVATSNTGGGKAHNHGNTGSSSNLPPYLAVYVWKRTA